MMRLIFNSLVQIMVEIISFILLIPVLLISCIVLLLTGKFSAFSFQKRKENTNSDSFGLIERIRSLFHNGHNSKERHLITATTYPIIADEDHE